MKRELDRIFFRIGRDNICFSDLTEEQMRQVLMNRSEEWLIEMCVALGKRIREIGDELDIYYGDEEEEE